jgi:hypothetical protein
MFSPSDKRVGDALSDMSPKEQPWDDETREFRGLTRGARIISFESPAEYRTRTAGSSPPLGPRPERPTTLAESGSNSMRWLFGRVRRTNAC